MNEEWSSREFTELRRNNHAKSALGSNDYRIRGRGRILPGLIAYFYDDTTAEVGAIVAIRFHLIENIQKRESYQLQHRNDPQEGNENISQTSSVGIVLLQHGRSGWLSDLTSQKKIARQWRRRQFFLKNDDYAISALEANERRPRPFVAAGETSISPPDPILKLIAVAPYPCGQSACGRFWMELILDRCDRWSRMRCQKYISAQARWR